MFDTYTTTLWQDSKKNPTTSACTPYSALLSSCSLSAPDFPVSKGFECKVKYNSPETGDLEEVIPDGCCAEPMYPENLPSGIYVFMERVYCRSLCSEVGNKTAPEEFVCQTALSLSLSFDAKVLPELPQDTKFCVEQNEKKNLWCGAEATSQLVTHWFQHLEKW